VSEAPFLRDNFAPVRDAVGAIGLWVDGEIPAELHERYSRFGFSTNQHIRQARMALLKTHLETGPVTEHDRAGRHHLDGVFVPREEAVSEAVGWVMAYVWNAAKNRSWVVIVSAQAFSEPPVVTIHLLQRVPFGFHGSGIAD
jgi:carotenoid cleavage dioxygenase-like enzyme